MQTVKFLERERSSERKNKELATDCHEARLAIKVRPAGAVFLLRWQLPGTACVRSSHSLLSPHNPPSAAVLAAHLVAVHSLTSNPEHPMNCK